MTIQKKYSDNDRCNKCSTFQIESWLDELCGNEDNPPWEMRRGWPIANVVIPLEHAKKNMFAHQRAMANPKNLDQKFFKKLAWRLNKKRQVDNKKIK